MTPLVVLLHALPFGAALWDGVREHLRPEAVAPDLYGHGPRLGDWAAGVLAGLPGHRPLVVVGSSVGGSCAVEVARRAPDRVQALLLLGTKPSVRHDPAARDEALALLQHGGVEQAWARCRVSSR